MWSWWGRRRYNWGAAIEGGMGVCTSDVILMWTVGAHAGYRCYVVE